MKAGIELAKSLGYTHVLHFRSDVHCNDIHKLIRICESYDKNKLVFLAWLESPSHNPPHTYVAYLMDQIIYGPINDMLMYYNVLRTSQVVEHFAEKLGMKTTVRCYIVIHIVRVDVYIKYLFQYNLYLYESDYIDFVFHSYKVQQIV